LPGFRTLVKECRVAVDALDAAGEFLGSVEVAAETDVADAGDPAGVLDVVGDVGDRHLRRLAEAGPLEPGRILLGEELRHERDHQDSPVRSQPGEHVIGHVAGMVGERAAGAVAEDHRRIRDVERRVRRRRRDVGEVDEHAEAVELAHVFDTARAEAVVHRVVGARIRPGGVVHVGEGQVPHPQPGEHPQHARGIVEAVGALRAQQGRDPAPAACVLDLDRAARDGERVGVPCGKPVDPVDLLERALHRVGALEMVGDVDGPELRPDPARAQTGDVGVGGQVAFEPLDGVLPAFAAFPCPVIVAVDEWGEIQRLLDDGVDADVPGAWFGGGHAETLAGDRAGSITNMRRTTRPRGARPERQIRGVRSAR